MSNWRKVGANAEQCRTQNRRPLRVADMSRRDRWADHETEDARPRIDFDSVLLLALVVVLILWLTSDLWIH